MDDLTKMYRQLDTPQLVALFATEVNAARVLPDPEGKHLLTMQAVEGETVEADITIKTRTGAEIIYVSMSAETWDSLPELPEDFFGDDAEDDDE